MKKRLGFDMDNVLVDFQSGIDRLTPEQRIEYAGRFDECPGIFALMDPYPGAIEAYNTLCSYYIAGINLSCVTGLMIYFIRCTSSC